MSITNPTPKELAMILAITLLILALAVWGLNRSFSRTSEVHVPAQRTEPTFTETPEEREARHRAADLNIAAPWRG